MSESEEDVEETPKKKSKLPLILGIVFAIAGAGGGFFVVQSGLLGGEATEETAEEDVEPLDPPLSDFAFVPMNPLVVSLGPAAQSKHLRFQAQLEVPKQYEGEVIGIMPRIVDVMNNYLRAMRPEDLEKPDSLIRLRAQILRRLQIVTGKGRVRDLLVMEFVLN